MGYRARPPQPEQRAPGACLEGHRHQAETVTLLSGETVAHICRHCFVRLRPLRPPGGTLDNAMWRPYSDDGHPLRDLPLTSRGERR